MYDVVQEIVYSILYALLLLRYSHSTHVGDIRKWMELVILLFCCFFFFSTIQMLNENDVSLLDYIFFPLFRTLRQKSSLKEKEEKK